MKTKVSREAKQKRDSGVRRHHRRQAEVYGRVHSVVRVAHVALCHLTRGAVILAHVPYVDDPTEGKFRPVIVVARQGDRVVVRPCTSAPSRHRYADTVELSDVQSAGLSRATGTRCNVVTLRMADLAEFMGWLSETDLERVFGGPLHATQAAA